MKPAVFALVALSLFAVAGTAASQTADTTAVPPPAAQPPVAQPPPTPPPPPPPPPPAPKPAAMQPVSYRWGGLGGVWTMPQADFKDFAGDGWGILILGEQFVNPTMMIAITSDVGYLDFGSKSIGNTKYDLSMFPVQAGLRVYPMAQKSPDSKAQLFGEGGLGFYTTRSETQTILGSTSNYDYYFGVNAGLGVKLTPNPRAGLLFDATWNWVFATGTDPNYLALRGAIVVPVRR